MHAPRSPGRSATMTETPRETRVLDAVVVAGGQPARRLRRRRPAHRAHRALRPTARRRVGRASCSPTRSGSCGCWRPPRRRPANWSCSNCRPTRARAWTAMPPGSRSRWPTCGRSATGGRGSSPAAIDAGFASVHAVPMRAAGIVLGALGLFGTRTGRAQRRRSAGGPDPGTHRLRGDPAGTPAHARRP